MVTDRSQTLVTDTAALNTFNVPRPLGDTRPFDDAEGWLLDLHTDEGEIIIKSEGNVDLYNKGKLVDSEKVKK